MNVQGRPEWPPVAIDATCRQPGRGALPITTSVSARPASQSSVSRGSAPGCSPSQRHDLGGARRRPRLAGHESAGEGGEHLQRADSLRPLPRRRLLVEFRLLVGITPAGERFERRRSSGDDRRSDRVGRPVEIETDPEPPKLTEQLRLGRGPSFSVVGVASAACPLDAAPVEQPVADHPHQPPLRVALRPPGEPGGEGPRGPRLANRQALGEGHRQFACRRRVARPPHRHHRQHLLNESGVGGLVGVEEFDRVEGNAACEAVAEHAPHLVDLADGSEKPNPGAGGRIGEGLRLRIDRQLLDAVAERYTEPALERRELGFSGQEDPPPLGGHPAGSRRLDRECRQVCGVGESGGRELRGVGLEHK